MRNVSALLGVILLAFTLLLSFIHIADAYLLALTIVGALLIGLSVVTWGRAV